MGQLLQMFAPLNPWMPCRAASGFQPDLIVSASGWTQIILGTSCRAKFHSQHSRKKKMGGWKTYFRFFFANGISWGEPVACLLCCVGSFKFVVLKFEKATQKT